MARGIRFAELLLRQEAVVRRAMPWEPLDFEERRVVEVGCGPLAGFGPLAVFCGAALFESAEPEWDPALFFSAEVRERYLRLFHADLCALYGPRMDFDAFEAALRDRMRIVRSGFEAAPIEGPVDVVLSQSCLEHVFPLEATVAKLAAIQNDARASCIWSISAITTRPAIRSTASTSSRRPTTSRGAARRSISSARPMSNACSPSTASRRG